jgi:hypothetical protein
MFEQDRVIVRLQQRINRESDVIICFLAGSFGRQTNDAFSDLDVVMVFADSAKRESAWQERYEFVRSLLPYISKKSFDATHIRPYFHIALYSNGAKVDFRYETRETLSPNPWDRHIRILKDYNGWGEQFQAASAQASLVPPRMSIEELTALDNRFWVMFWDVYRLLLRGDFIKPFTIYLQLLHFTLPALLHVLPAEDPAHQDLSSARFSRDTAVTAQHLVQLLQAYVAARASVMRQQNLAFEPNSAFESAINRLVQRTV